MSALRRARWTAGLALLAALAAPAAAGAQEPDLTAPCRRSDVPASARQVCVGVAQAVAATQPQLGLLLAAGNPTLGSASTAGLRVPGAPGMSLTGKLNFVPVRIPDLLDSEGATGAGLQNERTIPAPAVSVTLSASLWPGLNLAPTVGGIGSVDLLGSFTWMPLRALDISSFRLESSEFTYGIGARLGVLRESFTIPGASLSMMYRRFNEVGYGSVCEAALTGPSSSREGYAFTSGLCPRAGDPGEIALDITHWSGRGVLGKQLGRLGLAVGGGYDWLESDVGFGFRAPSSELPGGAGYVARAAELDVRNERWSAFGNLSFTTLVTTFAVEAGWMQGGEPVQGFSQENAFDPRRGIFFGSVGVRLSL